VEAANHVLQAQGEGGVRNRTLPSLERQNELKLKRMGRCFGAKPHWERS